MDLIEIIWDLPQQSNSGGAEPGRSVPAAKVETPNESVHDLRLRVIRLTSTCQVLCELLAEKLDITQEQLMQRIEQRVTIDPSRPPGHCPTCGQKFRTNINSCHFCGFEHQP